MSDRDKYTGQTQRNLLIDIRISQVKTETEITGIRKDVTNIETKLDNHKEKIWPKVDAHEKYINTQKGMTLGRTQIWGIGITLVVVIIAVLGLYLKTG